MSEPLERLAGELRAGSGLLAAATVPAGLTGPGSEAAGAAAAGPRTEGHREAYGLIVEAIREGYLLHYAQGRVVHPGDPDLSLLAGDQLFALGLSHLAALGDVAAVTELADVISLAAQAHAAENAELADAVWAAGACAVGWGTTPELEDAKARARHGDPSATQALRAATRRAHSDLAPGR